MSDRRRELIDLLADGAGSALEHLCAAAVDVTGVTGAAVIVMSEGEVGAIAAASRGAIATIEDLQFTLGEGPCLEAFRTGVPSFHAELDGGSRGSPWPAFAAAAASVGASAIFSIPLRVGAIRLGVLYLYRDHPGPLQAHERRDTFVLADIATSILLEYEAGAPIGAVPVGIGDDFGDRAAVHQATGMVSVQLGITLAAALGRLRAYSSEEDRSIYAVAVDVIDRRIRFT